MLWVTIDGRRHQFEGVPTILAALAKIGVEVPALCHDDRIKPTGACRLCVVSIRGAPRPVAACTTPLADGMEIETHSPEVENLRRGLLQLLARDYPQDALATWPDEPFHRALAAYGLTSELRGARRPELRDDSHPYLHVDMSQCISCFRCVRICDELQGQFVWRIWNRGAETRIRPDSQTTLRESSCVSCGACADSCPTGAIDDQTALVLEPATSWTRTTCPYCGVGCELSVGVRDQHIVGVRPVLDAPVSKGHLCVKGRYAFGFVEAADRVKTPLVRDGGSWRRASWDEAIGYAARRLRAIVDAHGAQAVGVLGSARTANEDNYVAQKFARLVLGTNNVDCCARVCHAPSAAALKAMLGTGAATSSYDDIERARTILVCGANATENHPIVGARIKQAALAGAKLIVVDPRRIELAEYADLHLAIRPGSNVALFNAVAHVIVRERLHDQSFVRGRVAGWDDFVAFVEAWTPERAADVCGVHADDIRRAARLYASERPSLSVHGLGMTEHVQGTDSVMALTNLALLTGNLGRAGAGVNPLRGQNNVQGAAHMGCEPRNLTGYVPLEEARARFEVAWKAPLPTTRGLDLMEMMDAADAGALKALWIVGYDVALTNPDAETTGRAFGKLDLVVVQDLFLDETAARFASVFLPAASSFERDGTFMNAERRVQRVRKAIAAVGESRPDWQILCAAARALGHADGFAFASAEQIWDEIRSLWKAGAGMSYARLEQGGLQWPCPTEDHPGTRILHEQAFASGARATLRCIDLALTAEARSDEFPLVLMTGRTLYQFNAGTMTMRTRNTVLRPRDVLDVSPEDADRLGLRDGDCVVVRSRYGKATLPVRRNSAVKPSELFATFHTAEAFLNRVIGPERDRATHTPQYKVTAVRIERG
jgi:formate dehydrogenase major subunit